MGELLYKGMCIPSLYVTVYSIAIRAVILTVSMLEGSFEAAEAHLLAAGKRDSARSLAEMFVEWVGSEGPADAFALKGTIP